MSPASVLLWASCRSVAPAPAPAAEVTAAACRLDDGNALRAWCSVTLDAPGAVAVTVSGDGVGPRDYPSEQVGVAHEILVWGLPALTTFDWEVGDFHGELTTGPLPSELDWVDAFEIDGALQGPDAVFFSCERSFVMVDGEGRVVWYEPATLFVGPQTGYTWSQADRSYLEIRADAALERDVAGRERMSLSQGGAFQSDLHHDVARWGTYTYLLGAVGSVDTVEVVDSEGAVGRFELDAWFALPYGAHANGITVDERGRIALSLRNYDAVVAIDGDPSSPGFLDVLFVVSGAPTSDLGPADFAPDAPLFHHQHHATFVGDDVWVFDNASGPESRALRTRTDGPSGALVEVASWSVGGSCWVQGGAVPLGDGVLATCSDGSFIQQFHEGSAQAAWTLRAGCDGWSMTRALPVWIP